MDTTQINPETAEYLDGPGLYAWLEEVDGLEGVSRRLGDRARYLDRWCKGGAASFYVADEILIRLGRHISEVPDRLYCAKSSPQTAVGRNGCGDWTRQ